MADWAHAFSKEGQDNMESVGGRTGRCGKRISAEGIVLVLILLAGCLVRLAALDKSPLGLHQDEAYSAYNAWSVMHYGVDSYGYVRPVYYTVWGSGMNVLYSWLTMPFLALLGTTVQAIRLPQAILGCLSIPVVYGLGKEMLDARTGLLFAGILAINPWHIQQSRFGLESALAVPCFLFSMYFLCRYLNGKRRSVWGAAFFAGLTLYSYALTWILVPGVLILCLIFFRKRFCFDRRLLGAALLLFGMAVPLLLFLAVNFDWIPEIRTGVFSVPKLPALRTGEMELSLSAFKRRFLWLVAMLWAQHDDMWWITSETAGSYYYISTPFILIGLLWHMKLLIDRVRKKRALPLTFLMAIWFAVAFAEGCCIDLAKYHKVNYLHIPVIFYGCLGIICVLKLLYRMKGRRMAAAGIWVTAGLYAAAFGYYLYSQAAFGVHYELYGNSALSHMHWYRYEEAIERAEELTDGDIGINGLNFANLILYKKISPYEYLDQVVYTDDEPEFRTVRSIGRYHFDSMPGSAAEEGDSMEEGHSSEDHSGEEDRPEVFVYPYMMEAVFREAGYVTEHVTECYGVAYRE